MIEQKTATEALRDIAKDPVLRGIEELRSEIKNLWWWFVFQWLLVAIIVTQVIIGEFFH